MPPSVLLPMESLSVAQLPVGKNWRYEPKWDGFRCVAFKERGAARLQSRSGRPLDRYFPDMVAVLNKLKAKQFILDGELLINTDEGYSFSELQMRLHPAASRVQKLVAEHPATFMLFDLIMDEKGNSLRQKPHAERRKQLERFYKKYAAKVKQILLSQQTPSLKLALKWATMQGLDGLVAKNIEDTYKPGERAMKKYKFIRTADCVVGGFRYGTGSKQVGSLLLGLYDKAGRLNHVGFTSSFAHESKTDITQKLKKLMGGSGFTGNAPGAPSRWSTERSAVWVPLQPRLVVEVSFDHVSDCRFRHGTRLMRWRPDKSPRQCTMVQLDQPRIMPMV